MSVVRNGHKTKWMWAIAGTVISFSIGGVLFCHRRSPVVGSSAPGGAYCDYGIGAAKGAAGLALAPDGAPAPTAAVPRSEWTLKINSSEPPGRAPAGMLWIPGGQFWMGSAEDRMTDARPWHRVYVDGYWMDKTEVTNEQFARFVKATRYVTVAERKPRPEDYPGAPPEKLVAGSVVFRRRIAPWGLTTITNGGATYPARTGAIRRAPTRISRTE